MTRGPGPTCHIGRPEARRRQTTTQGACNRPVVMCPFTFGATNGREGEPPHKERATAPRLSASSFFAKTGGQEGEPPRRKQTTAPRLCAPSASLQSAVQHADPGPHVMQPAHRLRGAEKSHRRLRQYRVPSGSSRKTEKISFQNQCSDSRHPAHGPIVTLREKVTGQSAVGTGMTVGVAIGGPTVIAPTGAQEQQADCQSDSGPTCRLASSPEASPEAAVSTLNQGYPLLQHEDAAPVQHLKATWRMVPNPTIWAGPRAPCGKER
jgi:hypothetical protein